MRGNALLSNSQLQSYTHIAIFHHLLHSYVYNLAMAHDLGEATSASIVRDQVQSPHSVSLSHRESDLLEATELSRIRSQYSRTTDLYRRASSSNSRASPRGLRRLTYAIWKFWRNQISVVVAHEACRDHLGMYQILSRTIISMRTLYLAYRTRSLLGSVPGNPARASVSHMV